MQVALDAPSQEDRLIAAACHLSSLVGFGVLAPLAIFFVKREQSRFVAQHALQALFLQLAWMLLTAVLVVGAFGVLALLLGVSLTTPQAFKDAAAVSSVMVILGAVAGFAVPGVLYTIALVLGTVECLQGKEANLPIFGSMARSACA